MISYLASGAPSNDGSFTTSTLASNLTQIRGWLDAPAAGSGNTYPGIRTGITEANICHINDVGSGNPTPGSDDLISGNGANSFIAGQFWAEMMAIGMDNDLDFINFWSAIEGSSMSSYETNVGFLNTDVASPWGGVGAKKSTFYHFKMMSSWFKGNFYPANLTGSSTIDIKAFGCKTTNYIAVMILNQRTSGSTSFQVHLNGTAGSSPLDITFGMGVSGVGYPESGSGIPIDNQSTSLLIFDCNGNFVKRHDYKITSPFTDPLAAVVEAGTGSIVTLGSTPAIGNGTYPKNYTLSGGSSYTWLPMTNVTLAGSNNFTITAPTTPITYTVTASSGGCSDSEVYIFMPDGTVVGLAPTGTITTSQATCAGGYVNGSATINITYCENGGCNILWSNGSTLNTITGLTPGHYSVTITDPGPDGNPSTSMDNKSTSYNIYLNPDFNMQKEVSAYTRWESYIKFAGTLTVKNGGVLDLRNNTFEFASNAKIVVESGGILNITNATLQSLACPGTWAGIEVQPGGTLNLENGALVKISGTGKLFIDEAALANGVFNYKPGAAVHLLDNTSVMEIKGQLNIAANANFTTAGNGYVKFSNPNSPSNNITAGTGSSMTFERSNASQKALEVTQESLLGPANLSTFKINNCLVVLGNDARIAPLGLSTQITCTNSTITSFAGRGLTIFGQPSVTINNTTFSGGKTGVYALLTYAGYPLTISNCTFENCMTGLRSHDKGIVLNNVEFRDCTEAAWSAEAMSQPSSSTNSIFGSLTHPNSYGIVYHGGGNGPLYLNNSKVNANYYTGIDMSGALLKVKCGEIKDNFEHGISLWHNASLNMSSDLNAGFVNASGNGDPANGLYTIFMNNARNLWLNNGFNNLATRGNAAFHCTATSVGCLMSVKGTMSLEYDPCTDANCAPIQINAYQNDWLNPGNALFARNGVEYDVKTGYNCVSGQKRTILLNDLAPATLVQCDVTGQKILSVLETCPTCPTINTTSFPNVKLNVAVQYAIQQMAIPGGGSKLAQELFYEILKQPYPLADYQTKNILEISYQLMLESLGQAFLKNEISATINTPVISDNVQKMIEIHNDRLIKYPCAEYYQQRLATSMEKAQTYRLANRRDLALAEFDAILTWAGIADQAYVQRWRCITNAELLLKTGLLQPEEFEAAIASCPSIGRAVSQVDLNENKIIAEKDKNGMTIQPNPAKDKFIISFSSTLESTGRITVKNIYGQIISEVIASGSSVEVDCSEYKNGVYLITLIVNGKVQNSEKLVIAK